MEELNDFSESGAFVDTFEAVSCNENLRGVVGVDDSLQCGAIISA